MTIKTRMSHPGGSKRNLIITPIQSGSSIREDEIEISKPLKKGAYDFQDRRAQNRPIIG